MEEFEKRALESATHKPSWWKCDTQMVLVKIHAQEFTDLESQGHILFPMVDFVDLPIKINSLQTTVF